MNVNITDYFYIGVPLICLLQYIVTKKWPYMKVIYKRMDVLYKHRVALIAGASVLAFGSIPFMVYDNPYVIAVFMFSTTFMTVTGFMMNINFYGKIFGRKEDTAEEKSYHFKEAVILWAGFTAGFIIFVPFYDEEKVKAAPSLVEYVSDLLAENDPINRGIKHAKNGEFDKAIAEYNKAIRMNPSYAIAYSNRGIAYKDRGDTDSAIADYSKAIQLNPMLSAAYINRAIIYDEKGDLDNAIADYTLGLKWGYDRPDVYHGRGRLYRLKDSLDKALADLDRAIVRRPDWADAYVERSFVHYKKGDTASVIADVETALRINPNITRAERLRAAVQEMREAKDTTANEKSR